MKETNWEKIGAIGDIVELLMTIVFGVVTLLLNWDDLVRKLPWLLGLPWKVFLRSAGLGVALAILALRFRTLKSFFLLLKAETMARSLFGSLVRLAVGVAFGVILLILIPPIGVLILLRWIVALATALITWLWLSLTSLGLELSGSLAQNSVLHNLPTRMTDLEEKLLSLQGLQEQVVDRVRMLPEDYPVQQMAWQYRLADVFGSSRRFLGITTWVNDKGVTYATTASCQGVMRKAIYQHPPLDGETDSLINFELRIPDHVKFLVLSFYTGIMDEMIRGGSVERSTFEPKTGNRVCFKILADNHLVFEETRDSFEWRYHSLVLPIPTSRTMNIDFCTNALRQPHCNWAVWGEPCLEDLAAVFADLVHQRKILKVLPEQVTFVTSQVGNFEVPAHKEEGIDTGLTLQVNDLLRIHAYGKVSIDWGETWMGPDGKIDWGPKMGQYALAGNTYFKTQDDEGPDGALLGWIGEDREASTFLIGTEYTKFVGTSGKLHLGVNDTKGAFGDNYADRDLTPTCFTVYVEIFTRRLSLLS